MSTVQMSEVCRGGWTSKTNRTGVTQGPCTLGSLSTALLLRYGNQPLMSHCPMFLTLSCHHLFCCDGNLIIHWLRRHALPGIHLLISHRKMHIAWFPERVLVHSIPHLPHTICSLALHMIAYVASFGGFHPFCYLYPHSLFIHIHCLASATFIAVHVTESGRCDRN